MGMEKDHVCAFSNIQTYNESKSGRILFPDLVK